MFNLEFPNRMQYYWHYLWKGKQSISKYVFRKGYIMVKWTASVKVKPELVVMKVKKCINKNKKLHKYVRERFGSVCSVVAYGRHFVIHKVKLSKGLKVTCLKNL